MTKARVPFHPRCWLADDVKAYSNCANQAATIIKNYTGYDVNGNLLASVDGVGAANPSLYSSGGCTLTRPSTFYITSAWTGNTLPCVRSTMERSIAHRQL